MDTNNSEGIAKVSSNKILNAIRSLRPPVLFTLGIPLAVFLFIELLVKGSDSTKGEGPIALVLLLAFLAFIWMTGAAIFVLYNMVKEALLFIIKNIKSNEEVSQDRVSGIINILLLSFFIGFFIWSVISPSGRADYLFVGGFLVIVVRYIAQFISLIKR